MIKKYNLERVRLMNYFQSIANIKSYLEQENLKSLSLKAIYDEYVAEYNLLDKALKPFRTSGLTERINELDEKRDQCLIGFAGHCRVFATFPDETKAKAGKYLLRVLDKYGKAPQEKSHQGETAIINNLLQDLKESKAATSVTTIGAEKWIADLKTYNTEFEKVNNARTQSDAAVVVGETKAARKEMYKVYVKTVKTINALALINGEDAYKRLINNINEEVEKAQTSVKQSLGSHTSKEEEETEIDK